MKAYITGCAGFIGSNMIESLIAKDWEIVGVDNLSTGRKEFISKFFRNQNFKFFNIDLCNQSEILETIKGSDYVFDYIVSTSSDFLKTKQLRLKVVLPFWRPENFQYFFADKKV